MKELSEPTPPAHNGMAAFAAGGSRMRLIRNHEVRSSGAFADRPSYDEIGGVARRPSSSILKPARCTTLEARSAAASGLPVLGRCRPWLPRTVGRRTARPESGAGGRVSGSNSSCRIRWPDSMPRRHGRRCSGVGSSAVERRHRHRCRARVWRWCGSRGGQRPCIRSGARGRRHRCSRLHPGATATAPAPPT